MPLRILGFVLVTGFLTGSGALASSFMSISSPPVLDIDVARSGLTRIEIEGEIIDDVLVFLKEAIRNLLVHPKGCLFFKGDGLNGTLNLALMTVSGVTQDVRLTLKDKLATPIVLRASFQGHQKAPKMSQLSQYKRWLRSLLNNKVPQSFSETFDFSIAKRANECLEALPFIAWKNSDYLIIGFKVSGDPGTLLDAANYKQTGDVALMFTHPAVPNEEDTFLYVIRPLPTCQKDKEP